MFEKLRDRIKKASLKDEQKSNGEETGTETGAETGAETTEKNKQEMTEKKEPITPENADIDTNNSPDVQGVNKKEMEHFSSPIKNLEEIKKASKEFSEHVNMAANEIVNSKKASLEEIGDSVLVKAASALEKAISLIERNNSEKKVAEISKDLFESGIYENYFEAFEEMSKIAEEVEFDCSVLKKHAERLKKVASMQGPKISEEKNIKTEKTAADKLAEYCGLTD